MASNNTKNPNETPRGIKRLLGVFRKNGGSSLRRRLSRMTILPVICVALIMGTVSVVALNACYNNTYADEAVSLAQSYSGNVQSLIESLEQQFGVVIKNEDVTDQSMAFEYRTQLLADYADMSDFKDLSIAFADGTTYNNTDISQRDYFVNAMASKSAYISSPLLRLTDNSVTIMMGKYFSLNNEDYLVYGGLPSDTISNLVEHVNFGEGAVAYIIDKDGMVIGTSSDELLPIMTMLTGDDVDAKYSGIASISTDMLEDNTGTAKVSFNGETYFVGYAPIEGAEGWSIAVATRWAPVVSTMSVLGLVVLGVAVLAAVVVSLNGSRFVKRICTPITLTADRLTAFANGDLSSPAPTTDMGGEIQDMADALGVMVTTLTGCIGDIRNVLTSMADGDLTVKPAVEYKGELSEIKTSLDMISVSLNKTMGEVARSANEVKEGANQLADGSTQLSQNAITQAAAVEEITSTIMDIAKKTDANAQNVSHALETVENTNQQAEQGARSMGEMLEAIREIESSSREISNIMKVIDDIAFQTNILSLNAAIEAARAGEAGKGFAVVADEVRNLAGKSADAAKQTGELIERSISAVNRGAELAGVTSDVLHGIVSGVGDISKVMSGIAEANDEQTAAIGQISGAMENVNGAIHNTTATAEQSAAASEELSALAVTLSDEVSHFRTTAN